MSNAPTQFSWTAQTHKGRVRRNNEDAFLAMMFDAQEFAYLGKEGEAPAAGNDFIFAVSDGMGGPNAGEFASKTALQAVTNLVSREFHQKARSENADNEKLLADFCQRIHEEVFRVGRHYEECRGMGATLSLCWFHDGDLHLAHVGDSRVYLVPAEGEMRQLSDDHTEPGRQLRAGKITERQARSHPEKHILERSIGCHSKPVNAQIATVSVSAGDQIVLCSDGITDGMWDHTIEKIIRTPPPYLKDILPAGRLVKEALEASGRDNLTAMVVQAH